MNDLGEEKLLELLIFELAGQRYGLPVSDVREIVRAVPLVLLPGAPGIVEGVINVRGSVVPVLDVRRRFRLPPRPLQHTDHLVIARLAGRPVALRVDRAVGLARLAATDVEDLPDLSTTTHASRIAKLPGDLVLIQDLRALLSQAESAALDQALPAPPSSTKEGGPP